MFPWVQALLAAGRTVYAVNPRQAARYRECNGVSGAESDPGDAPVLAELVRLDRAHHRPIAGDSAVAEHVTVVARTHQSTVWSRQRQTDMLRSLLREYYPAALRASPGARKFHDAHRARDHTHLALRALANRPVGVLHDCLRHRRPYDEAIERPPRRISPWRTAAA